MELREVKVHRWQPTGYSPCGRDLEKVAFSGGEMFDDGVTCVACKRNSTRIGFLPAYPHPTEWQRPVTKETR